MLSQDYEIESSSYLPSELEEGEIQNSADAVELVNIGQDDMERIDAEGNNYSYINDLNYYKFNVLLIFRK